MVVDLNGGSSCCSFLFAIQALEDETATTLTRLCKQAGLAVHRKLGVEDLAALVVQTANGQVS